MSEPTPRPWKYDFNAGTIFATVREQDIRVVDVPQVNGEQEANARLIVTAVNCHDELVDALQWFIDRVDAGEVRSRKSYNKFKTLLDKVREQESQS